MRRSAEPGQPKNSAKRGKTTPAGADSSARTPSQVAPTTYADYEKAAKEKLRKRNRQIDDFDYDNGVEYETGLDY